MICVTNDKKHICETTRDVTTTPMDALVANLGICFAQEDDRELVSCWWAQFLRCWLEGCEFKSQHYQAATASGPPSKAINPQVCHDFHDNNIYHDYILRYENNDQTKEHADWCQEALKSACTNNKIII